MAHAVESMAYVGETPWHGLGTNLEAPPSVAEAIRVAGLNWQVNLVRLQMPDGRQVDRYATVRSTDNKVLGTVGPDYVPVQNDRAFAFFEPYVQSGAATIDTAGSLRGGSRVWMLAQISRPDSVIVPAADDRVRKYLVLANGHDGSLALHVGLTPIRVVCQNTLSAALDLHTAPGRRRIAVLKIRHTSGAEDAMAEVQETIAQADADFERAAEVFRALAGRSVNAAALKRYVDLVFRPKRQQIAEGGAGAAIDAVAFMADLRSEQARAELADEILTKQKETKDRIYDSVVSLFEGGRGNDAPGVRGTAWAAYNAVTEYLSWERGSQDNRVNAALVGGDSGLGARAVNAAAATFLAS